MSIQAIKFHLHSDVDEVCARHHTAEAKECNKQGKFAWTVQGRRPNHLHDAKVYAAAMADPECNGGVYVLKGPQVMPATPIAAGAIADQQAQVVRSNYVQSMLGNR